MIIEEILIKASTHGAGPYPDQIKAEATRIPGWAKLIPYNIVKTSMIQSFVPKEAPAQLFDIINDPIGDHYV